MEKTNKAITVTELLPLLSEAARNEVLELAEKRNLELAEQPTLPKPEDILPEWHSEICRATKTITDHISITVLRHVKKHLAAMGDDDADFQSVCFGSNSIISANWMHTWHLMHILMHMTPTSWP